MTVEEKRRFEQIEKQMSDMRKYMYGMGAKLDDVINLLKGDDFGNEGMVKRVNKLENMKNRITWTIVGASIPSGYGIWEFLKKVLPPLMILILFTGCLSVKKREDITHRYLREHPTTLAELCAIHYPALPRTGPIVTVRDTTVLTDTVDVECPDSTIVKVPTVVTRYVEQLRVDTLVDGALVDQLSASVRALEVENGITRALLDDWRERAKNRLWWAIGLGVALAASVVLRFVKLF